MKTRSKGIIQPDVIWDAFEDAADEADMSLSAWIAKCCIPHLSDYEIITLPERTPDRPPRDKTPDEREASIYKRRKRRADERLRRSKKAWA